MSWKDPNRAREYNAAYVAKHREALGEQWAAYRVANRERKAAYDASPPVRARQRLKRHGLTPCQFTRMRIAQGDTCALCPATATEIDHDHGTRRVRGLLCAKCNTGIGKLGDSVEGMRRALAYLEGTTHVV